MRSEICQLSLVISWPLRSVWKKLPWHGTETVIQSRWRVASYISRSSNLTTSVLLISWSQFQRRSLSQARKSKVWERGINCGTNTWLQQFDGLLLCAIQGTKFNESLWHSIHLVCIDNGKIWPTQKWGTISGCLARYLWRKLEASQWAHQRCHPAGPADLVCCYSVFSFLSFLSFLSFYLIWFQYVDGSSRAGQLQCKDLMNPRGLAFVQELRSSSGKTIRRCLTKLRPSTATALAVWYIWIETCTGVGPQAPRQGQPSSRIFNVWNKMCRTDPDGANASTSFQIGFATALEFRWI